MNNDEYFNTDHLKQNLKTRAIRGGGATILAQISIYGIQTIGTIILARILTPDDFGLIAMVAAFSMLLQNLGLNGFLEAIIQKEEINHRQISNLFWINIAFSLILTFLLIAISPIIVGFYKEPRLKLITITMAFSIIFSNLSTQHWALLKRNMRFYSTSISIFVATIFSVAIPIFLATKGWGYWALVMKHLINPLVITISAWILCGWRPGWPTRGAGVLPMLKFSFNTGGNFCVIYLQRNLDKILLGRFYGSQLLGNYDRAYHLSSMLPNQLTVPLTSVAIASLSRLSNEPEKYRYYYSRVLSMLAFTAMPLSAALTLTGRDLIILLLGSQWDKAGEIFSVIAPGISMIVIYGTHLWLHLSLGRADRLFRWAIFAFIITVIIYLIGLLFGPLGVAIAYSASFYILVGPALHYAGKPLELKLSFFLATIWKYFASACIAALLCWFIFYFSNFTSHIFGGFHIIIRIAISFVLCISIYLVTIIILYNSTKPITQFISVLRDMIPKF